MEAASPTVIKFKYGDLSRRCYAEAFFEHVHDFSLNVLKKKALSLFGLARETEIMLTYIDEDGDLVNLVDADELRDVGKQGLNPVRITVKVVSENNARRLNQPNLSSVELLPSRSAHVQQNSGVLKNVADLIKLYKSQTTDKLTASSGVRGKIPAQVITKDTRITKFNDVVPEVQENNMLTDINGGSVEASSSKSLSSETVSSSLNCGNINIGENNGPKTENYIASDARPVVPRKHMPYKIKGYWDLYEPKMSLLETKEQQISMYKLDSCLIEHVTFKDDTIMGPLTQFTKVWRMRNCGLTAWPEKTRLVCASCGGFSRYSVELEIPEGGVPVGGDLDIAVDLVAPAVPGSYISFWSMASSGLLFGPRVFVLIQVDASIETGTITANVEPEPEPELYNPNEVDYIEKTEAMQMVQQWEEMLRRSSATWDYTQFEQAHHANTQNNMVQTPAPTPTPTIVPTLPPSCSSLNSQSCEEQLKLMEKQIQRQIQRQEDLRQLQQQYRSIKTRGQTQHEQAHQANTLLWASQAGPVIGPNSLTILTSLISRRQLEVIDRHKHMQMQMEEMLLQLLEEQKQQQRELLELAARDKPMKPISCFEFWH